MECSRTRELLEEFFEGTLPRRLREAVRTHLSECGACAAELGRIERVTAALESAPRVEPSGDLLRAIAASAAELSAPGARQAAAAGWRQVVLLAGMLVAVLAGLRYAGTLVWPRVAAALAPAVGWAARESASALAWVEPRLHAAWVLVSAVWQVAEALGDAAAAVGLAAAVYAAAEVALLVGVVLVVRRSRRSGRTGVTFVL